MKNKLLVNLISCSLLIAATPMGLSAGEVAIHPALKDNAAPPFEIRIPENFILGWKESDPKAADLLYEFVPQGEDVHRWSELITVHIVQVNDVLAQFLTHLKSGFDRGASKSSILKSELTMRKEEGAQVGVYIFDGPYSGPLTSFKPSKTENEIVIMKATRAKDRSVWLVQYAVRYPKNLSSDEKSAMVDKLWAFADDCKVIKPKK